jgi:hypothetical protein
MEKYYFRHWYGMYLEECTKHSEGKPARIGSLACRACSKWMGRDEEENWIKCRELPEHPKEVIGITIIEYGKFVLEMAVKHDFKPEDENLYKHGEINVKKYDGNWSIS